MKLQELRKLIKEEIEVLGLGKPYDSWNKLKDIELINPVHITLVDDGGGEFPSGYKLTPKGIEYILKQIGEL